MKRSKLVQIEYLQKKCYIEIKTTESKPVPAELADFWYIYTQLMMCKLTHLMQHLPLLLKSIRHMPRGPEKCFPDLRVLPHCSMQIIHYEVHLKSMVYGK